METRLYAGERVKTIRETKGIAPEALAESAGIELQTLQKIEESQNMPSLAVLIKVARALGVRLGTFLEGQEELGPVHITHQEIEAGFNPGGTATTKRQMQYFSLSQSKAGRHMESFIIRFEPCAELDFVLSSHEGEEFIYVLDGAVEINYGQDTYQLQAGDSIYYDAIVSHHVHAECGAAAKILAVIYTPF